MFYFLLKELPHDDNHPQKKRAGCRIPKTRQWKKNDLLNFLQTKTLNIDNQLMDSLFIKWWVRRFKAYVEHAALEEDTKIQSTQDNSSIHLLCSRTQDGAWQGNLLDGPLLKQNTKNGFIFMPNHVSGLKVNVDAGFGGNCVRFLW